MRCANQLCTECSCVSCVSSWRFLCHVTVRCKGSIMISHDSFLFLYSNFNFSYSDFPISRSDFPISYSDFSISQVDHSNSIGDFELNPLLSCLACHTHRLKKMYLFWREICWLAKGKYGERLDCISLLERKVRVFFFLLLTRLICLF